MRRARLQLATVFLLFTAVLILSMQAPSYAQQQPAGVVTAVQGQAELTRGGAPKPTLLRQKDGVMIRDVIDTQEKSMARMLFGGKATITLKELSRFEVREETLPGGATRSTVELNSGALLINVARELMKPGDEIIIRTDNAIAAVRGSMVYAESLEAAKSTFVQLSGEAAVASLPPATSPTATLTRFTAVDITGQGANSNVGAIRTITEDFATVMLRSFQLPRTVTKEGSGATIVRNAITETAVIADAALVPGTRPVLPPIIPPPPPPTILPGGEPITPVKLPGPCRTCPDSSISRRAGAR